MMKNAVMISCFNWYQSRLKPIREMLVSRGYNVSVLIADFDHITKAPVARRYEECTYIHVPAYNSNVSFQRMRSHMVFGKAVSKQLDAVSPEIVFCQVPPNNVAKRCGEYKEKHPTVKLILDIIDLWPESLPLSSLKNTPPAKAWRKWRDDSIRIADHVFTECNLYQERLHNVIVPEKTSTLYLCKRQSSEEQGLTQEIIRNRNDTDTIKFAYLGSMNNIIDIEGICSVIKRFSNTGKRCELHAIGDGESRTSFEAAASASGCQTHFYGLVFDATEKIKILAPCDYAFNMMKEDATVGLTTKSIDYLSYGLPLINNIKGDTWRLVEEESVGVNVGDFRSPIQAFDHQWVRAVFETYFSEESFLKIADGVLK